MRAATVKEKWEILLKIGVLRATTSTARACAQVGISQATFIRWSRAFLLNGIEGLEPKYANCGRNKTAKK